MPDQYLIYCINPGGWVTRNGTYSSDVTRAVSRDWDEARRVCLKQRDHDGNLNWIPVRKQDVEALRDQR